MSDDLMLDVDQAGELKAAFRRGNWTNTEIKRLCEGRTLAEVRNVLLGRSEIKLIPHAINCNADPFVPDGWRVKDHKKGGIFTLDPTTVKLYLSEHQKGHKRIVGNDLRKELANQPVLNANVLDYLLKPESQHLIPEDWKGKYVFFWGTIYRYSGDRLCVRYLYRDGVGWLWLYLWLDDGFNGDRPAAVRAR